MDQGLTLKKSCFNQNLKQQGKIFGQSLQIQPWFGSRSQRMDLRVCQLGSKGRKMQGFQRIANSEGGLTGTVYSANILNHICQQLQQMLPKGKWESYSLRFSNQSTHFSINRGGRICPSKTKSFESFVPEILNLSLYIQPYWWCWVTIPRLSVSLVYDHLLLLLLFNNNIWASRFSIAMF